MKTSSLYILRVLVVVCTLIFFISCDRENLYDIASGKSRTVYAIAYDGTTYTLIIASKWFDKTFTSNFAFPSPFSGIAVNQQHVIVYAATSTYKADNNLTSWLLYAPFPPTTPVIGYNDTFISLYDQFSLSSLQTTSSWDPISIPGATNCSFIFNGYDGKVYVYDETPSLFWVFSDSAIQMTISFLSSPGITPIGGYRTKNYYYIWSGNGNNSIFRTNGITDTNFNTTITWTSVIDVAVTDDDKIFAIINEVGNISLIQIHGDNDYTPLISLGNVGNFIMDCLDDDNIVIASYGNPSGYNGLFIYNINDKKIENFITTQDIIAIYVPRF